MSIFSDCLLYTEVNLIQVYVIKIVNKLLACLKSSGKLFMNNLDEDKFNVYINITEQSEGWTTMTTTIIVLYCIVLYCIVLYCIVLYIYCIVLYCIVLYCIVLYCIVLISYWSKLFLSLCSMKIIYFLLVNYLN